jgi:hypothetical protein
VGRALRSDLARAGTPATDVATKAMATAHRIVRYNFSSCNLLYFIINFF